MPAPLDLSANESTTEASSLTFIGTATVLIHLGPFTFLTDPNFLHAGEHAYLGAGLHSKRLIEPAMQISDLPPLDFVLLSHHHGDHFDDRVAVELSHEVPIITEPHSAKWLDGQGFNRAIALNKWDTQEVRKGDALLRVTAMPGKHSPTVLAPLIPPVMGSLVELQREGQEPYRVYITGDTLFHDELAEIPKRYPDIDLCIIHLGGTRIAGVLLTMDAKQGVKALQLVAPKAAVPIHYGDYGVFKSPISDFKAMDNELGDMDIHYLDRGDTLPLQV